MAKAKSKKPQPSEEEAFQEKATEPLVGVNLEESADNENPRGRMANWSRVNMTGFESKVWKFLGKDDNPWAFMPQMSLYGYLVDFYSPKYQLVLEADGPNHLDSVQADEIRDQVLLSHGVKTLRLKPIDFVQYTGQQLFDRIEYVIHPARVVEEEQNANT